MALTYLDLYHLLQSMEKEQHSAMTDAQRVAVLFDNELYYVDIAESLVHGTLVLIPDISQE